MGKILLATHSMRLPGDNLVFLIPKKKIMTMTNRNLMMGIYPQPTAKLMINPRQGQTGRGTGKKKKKSEKVDLYELLGLENVRWMATEEQIKSAYKKKALLHHPDKAGESGTEKFKAIQEAFDVLSDPAKRREFDSTDDFDDTLPVDCAPQDFFKVFGPAFRRNARWSVAQPVPDFGDENTEWDKVNAFYDFWYAFKSWREFPHPDEEDIEQFETREERRYFERINAKLREVGKKEERRRFKEFISKAYELDPRVARRKLEKKLEREKKKNEKAEAARLRAEELERERREAAERAEAEEARAAEEAAEQRKIRQEERRAMKKERQLLRRLCSGIALPDEDLESLCASLNLEELQSLNVDISAEGVTQQNRLMMVTDRFADLKQARQQGEIAKREAQENAARSESDAKKKAAAAAARDWSDEEVRLLQKGLVKFPVGTPRRWEQVTAYVRTRTQDEVTEMAKVGLKARPPSTETFTVVKKRQGNTTIKDNATSRLEAFTDVEINLKGPAALAVSAEPPVSAGVASSSGTARTTTGKAAAAAEGPALKNGAAQKDGSLGAAKATAAPESSANSSQSGPVLRGDSGGHARSENGAATSESAWTEVQELALVQALKKVAKDDAERWDKIAALVPNRSKLECMKRFKEIRTSFKSKKAGS
eukprot:jgi/Botrbrau1/23510/Bobra.106_1s0061.1